MRYTIPLVAIAAASAVTASQKTTRKLTPEALVKEIKLDNLLSGARKLQEIASENDGNRGLSGPGHYATTEWLYNTLLETGYYDVYKQPFNLFDEETIHVTADSEPVYTTRLLGVDFPDMTANLIKVNNLGCNATDFPAGIANQIAFISADAYPDSIRKTVCDSGDPITNAHAAGAKAVFFYKGNRSEHRLVKRSHNAGQQSQLPPLLFLPPEASNKLFAKLENGTFSVTIQIEHFCNGCLNYNVIAETKQGDHDNVLMLGAHADSNTHGTGINDDGSGTVGILITALNIAKYSNFTNAVRFSFWGAEEPGSHGSSYWVRNLRAGEIAKVRAYLNFDMIASPNYVLAVLDGSGTAFNVSGPPGSDVIQRDFQAYFNARDIPLIPTFFDDRSDYVAFMDNGIPVGGLFTGTEVLKTEVKAKLVGGEAGKSLDACYYIACDDIKNLSADAFLINTQAIANSVARYALGDWRGVPRSSGEKFVWETVKAEEKDKQKGKHRKGKGEGKHFHQGYHEKLISNGNGTKIGIHEEVKDHGRDIEQRGDEKLISNGNGTKIGNHEEIQGR